MELTLAARPLGRSGAMSAVALSDAAALLRDGEVSAEDYARELTDRCEQAVGLNAFLEIDRDGLAAGAREADLARRSGRALGPLHGLPIALKGNIGTQALTTSGGTRRLADFRPMADAPVVRRLFDAGALLLGKTNLHELSMGWTGANAAYGPVRNPHDYRRVSGGSSSGTACAVAAGLAPAGLGTDTNGSLRIPASFCGIASLRPTLGRYPTAGIIPLSWSLDTVGPMARSVADLALLDAVMSSAPTAAPRVSLSGVRIGLLPDYFQAEIAPDVADVFDDALVKLAEAGAEILNLSLPDLARCVEGVAADLIHYEAARALPAYLAKCACPWSLQDVAALAGADVRQILMQRVVAGAPDPVWPAAYAEALEKRRLTRARLRVLFDEHSLDLLAYPTAHVAAPLIGDRLVSPAPDFEENGFRLSARTAFGKNVAPSAIAGLPSLTLPAGLSAAGLPVGMDFGGREGGDLALLAVGFAIERALGPFRPPNYRPPAPHLRPFPNLRQNLQSGGSR